MMSNSDVQFNSAVQPAGVVACGLPARETDFALSII